MTTHYMHPFNYLSSQSVSQSEDVSTTHSIEHRNGFGNITGNSEIFIWVFTIEFAIDYPQCLHIYIRVECTITYMRAGLAEAS